MKEPRVKGIPVAVCYWHKCHFGHVPIVFQNVVHCLLHIKIIEMGIITMYTNRYCG